MTTARTAPIEVGPADLAEAVLREAADNLDLLIYAEAHQLELAVDWARLHPGDDVDLSIPYGDRELQVAGDGAPTVAEFAIADFALALGLSTDAGRNLIGDAVEIHYRLPGVWAGVITGKVRAWKARKVAQATRCLSPEAAAYVDRQLAPVAGRCSTPIPISRSTSVARWLSACSVTPASTRRSCSMRTPAPTVTASSKSRTPAPS